MPTSSKRTRRAFCEPLERRILLANTNTFSGSVFHDHNGNGVRDAGDEVLSFIQVFLDRNNNGTWESASEELDLTDASGNWSITLTSVTVGTTYRFRQSLGNNWIPTAPTSGVLARTVTNFTIFPVTGLDFGDAHPASVSGVIYEYLNGNFTRDAGEPGVPNRQASVQYGATSDIWYS